MIVSLIIGRGGSTGVPGKNVKNVLGRPLMTYPIMAAKNTTRISKIFVSTDSDEMKSIARQNGCEVIDRPSYLATKEALAEDAYLHGYEEIVKRIGEVPSILVLLFCNSPTILPSTIDIGIDKLLNDESYDSAVTTSIYNMYSPLRARKVDTSGNLVPFINPKEFDGASCDRDSQGDTYFADCSAFIVRPRCFDFEVYGEIPFRWIGKKVFPIKQSGGCDVDNLWQLGHVEFWLKENGFRDESTPYDES